MVQGYLETDKVKYTEANYTESESQGLSLHREPSFSRWCDEDEIFHSDCSLESADGSVEDFNFELSLFQQLGLNNGILGKDISLLSKSQQFFQVDGGKSMEVDHIHLGESGNGKYVPFDIENRSERKLNVSRLGLDGNNTAIDYEESSTEPPSSFSASNVLKTLFLILVWYTFSTFLTLYNKSLLGDDLGKFPAPLLMNTIHFTMQAVLSNAIRCYWSHRFHPSAKISWRDYFIRVVPTALATALDVNLSNASLVFISVTFATMCKSAAPIFLLIFAFAFRLESPSFKLFGIMFVISIGVLLTVAKETEFELWGFIFVMLAAVMSGFRWTMTQILLQKDSYGLKNPLTLMSYVTPVMALSTALFSLIFDPWDEFRTNNYFNSSWHVTRSCLLMLFGGTLAFFMVLTEFILVSVTSAVTVTIAGVVKEAVTILVAVFYFHDQFTWLKGAGLFTIMIGVSLFNWYKYLKLQKGEASEAEEGSMRKNGAAKYVILEEMDDHEDDT